MDYERAMLAYCELAAISATRMQQPACEQFLMLAGAAACRAGWLEVAEAARARLLALNPHLLLGKFSTFPAALRDPEFQRVVRRKELGCSFETAEHLLMQIGRQIREVTDGETAGEVALALLAPIPS